MTTIIKRKIYQIPILFFLSSVFLLPMKGLAQTPGGVTDVNVHTDFWLKADVVSGPAGILPAKGSLIGEWKDVSGNSRHFIAPGSNNSTKPRFMASKPMNFNPSVTFDQAAARLVTSASYLDRNKSYYLFYVSQEKTSKSNTSAVFNFIDYYDYNTTGWIKGKPYYRTDNKTYYPHGSQDQLTSNNYTITGVVRPSGLDPQKVQQFYIDGVVSTDTPRRLSVAIDNAASNNYNNIIGSSSGTSNSFYGDVQEIIFMEGPSDYQLSDMDAAKINSYLAIKYGITLQLNVDYVNSSESPVWVKANNDGYNNNIFGIANDPASGLNQRQSTSTNKRTMTVFVGPNVTTLNNDNQGSLPNNTYLLLGSNAKDGYSPYEVVALNGFTNGGSLSEIKGNYKHNVVHKARLTGASNITVNMELHINATYVLVSNNPNFIPTQSALYPVVDGKVTGVAISDESYIGILTSTTAPGGINRDIRMWLNASDAPQGITNQNFVDQWRDRTTGILFEYKTNSKNKNQPKYEVCSPQMNFHEAVDFWPKFVGDTDSNHTLSYLTYDGTNGYNGGTGIMSRARPHEYTVVTSLFSRFGNPVSGGITASYFMGFGDDMDATKDTYHNRRPAFGVTNRNGYGVGRFWEGSTQAGIEVEGYKSSSPYHYFYPRSTTIALHEIYSHIEDTPMLPIPDRYVRFEFDGQGFTEKGPKDDAYGLGYGAKMNDEALLGIGSRPGRNMDGLMSEIIAYETVLTQAEKDAVYSYLSLKYGTTLNVRDDSGTDTYFDYTITGANPPERVPIWQGRTVAEDRLFHHNIAALVRDDVSDLNNMQARSTAEGAIVHMGIGKKLGCNADLTGYENDGQALVWGHNGVDDFIDLDPNDPAICGVLDQRMGKMWMVRKTGTETPSVLLAAYGDYFRFQSAEVFILIADTKEKLLNNNWDEIIPMIYDETSEMHQIEYTFSNERTYFTFGIKGDATECEGCQNIGYDKVDYKNWARGQKSGVYTATNIDLRTEITITEGTSFLRTGYPRRHSGTKSLRVYRKGNPPSKVTTKIAFMDKNSPTVKSAATAEFDIFDIDYDKGNYDIVNVYGICSGVKVYPELEPGKGTKSYLITNKRGEIKAVKRSSSYSSKRGRVHVAFNTPVEEIYVEYTASGSAKASRWIGIGSLTLACGKQKPPAPPTNEEGMSFSKEAKPTVVELCEEVEYVYRIFNAHCDSRVVQFEDELPEGMRWVPGSLELDAANMESATINDYANTRTITIDNLSLTSGGEYKFSMLAEFEEDAEDGEYKNRAITTYKRVIEGEEQVVVLPSQDYWDSTQDSTTVVALPTALRLKNIELLEMMQPSSSCYAPNAELTFALTINNPNVGIPIANVAFAFIFNEEFSFVAGSLKSSTMTFTNIVADAGEGFVESTTTIPPGTHSIEFTVKVPAMGSLIPAVDEDGNLIVDEKGRSVYIPLEVDFEMYADDDDAGVCEDAILQKINGFWSITSCPIKDYIITNKNVTLKLVR